MGIGMKRGTVYLEEHQLAWEHSASETIADIKAAAGDLICDVQHIGSTSVKHIKAKPIIDIAVAVNDYDEVIAMNHKLSEYGIIFRFDERPKELLYVKGDFDSDIRTHHIHFVLNGSKEWNNYVNFRDYLNANKCVSCEYEAVKSKLAELYPCDRFAYTEGKSGIISRILQDAEKWREKDKDTI